MVFCRLTRTHHLANHPEGPEGAAKVELGIADLKLAVTVGLQAPAGSAPADCESGTR